MNGEQFKLFVYQDGRDFAIPTKVLDAGGGRQTIPLLERVDRDGNCLDGMFVVVGSPEEADFIIYPYFLEPIIAAMRTLYTHFFLRSLPFFYSYEQKHVFFTFHDRGQPLLTTGLIITASPNKNNIDDDHVMSFPYFPLPHILQYSTSIDFTKIRYDVSFTGTLSDNIRIEMIKSISCEKKIRKFLKYPKTVDWSDKNTSYLHMPDMEKRKKLESVYVNSIVKSWAVLCPRGMGSSSIRFYETLCMGRIPIHISDDYTFPYDWEIDYSKFCINIPQREVSILGKILVSWFSKKTHEELVALCTMSRIIYETFFQPSHSKRIAIDILRRYKSIRQGESFQRYIPIDNVLRCSPPRIVATRKDMYDRLEIDNNDVWLNKGCLTRRLKDNGNDVMLECNGVPGWFSEQELQFLFTVGAALSQAGTIVEIGGWRGLSSILLANALFSQRNLDARIYCVDDWIASSPEPSDGHTRDHEDPFQAFLKNIQHVYADIVITAIRAQSNEAALLFKNNSVDILFIDGDHSYSTCLQTLTHWFPTLKPCGIVIGHGYDVHPDNEVYIAVKEFSKMCGIHANKVEGARFFSIRKPKSEVNF